MIRARHLTFRYAGGPGPALSDVSFELGDGECLLVVGPSGSGKSTLALAIAGLIPREVPGEWHGRLEVAGLDPVEARGPDLAAHVGILFQDPGSQLVMDRVEDDVAFGLENRGWERDAMLARVPEALALVGLERFGRRRPTSLSGGEQQRLALAGVLAPRPGILVLDEPTANLDPAGTHAFYERLHALRAADPPTIVLIEHRVDRAWPLADRVLALGRDGSMIDVGRPEDVLARSGPAMEAAGIWLPEDRNTARPPGEVAMAPGQSGGEVDGAAVVRATGVAFGFERSATILQDVDLALGPADRVALVGANGSGKSTLARLLVGLLQPERGRVRLLGKDPARLRAPELSRLAGFVFQDPERQFLAATVEDEVMLNLRPEDRRRAADLMERLGLPLGRFAQRSPYRLSGGEQRRLSLASALVRRPSLLVLDEPTFGQDRSGYEDLVAILRERVSDGAAVLAATHDERFVTDFASRVIELVNGRLGPRGAEASMPSPAPVPA